MNPVARLRAPAVFLAPGLILILVAIGGRYTLDRAGLQDLAWVDLRVVGLIAGLAVLAVDLARRKRVNFGRRPEGWLVVTTLFFLFQIASGLWAPPAARVGSQTLDLVLMMALTIAVYLYAVGNPTPVLRTTFMLLFITAVIFSLGALFISSPGEQGRYSAFGGGPNVFVRIEIIGVISAIALFQYTRKILPLLVVPLFLLGAVLSGSRGGLLAAAAVGGVALLRHRRRLRAGTVLIAFIVLAIAVAVIWALAPPAFISLFQDRFVQQTVEQHYTSDRTGILMSALQLAIQHPLVGAGLDGFYGLVGKPQGIEYPHNYVLGVAAEGGIVGLILLATAVVLWVRTVRGGGGHPREAGLAMSAAVYVAISSLFSGDYYDSRLAWLFAAMAAAAAVTPARLDAPAPSSAATEPPIAAPEPPVAAPEPPVAAPEPSVAAPERERAHQ